MKSVNIYAASGGWLYEVWIASRIVVFGWCATRERAEHEASFA